MRYLDSLHTRDQQIIQCHSGEARVCLGVLDPPCDCFIRVDVFHCIAEVFFKLITCTLIVVVVIKCEVVECSLMPATK